MTIMILVFPAVVSLFTGTLFALEASNEEKDKGRIDRIEKELTREKELYQHFGEKEKRLLAQLSDLEIEIAKKRSLLQDLRNRITQTKQDLGKRRKRPWARRERDWNRGSGRFTNTLKGDITRFLQPRRVFTI